MIKRKIEREIKEEQDRLAKEKESGFLGGFFSKKPKKSPEEEKQATEHVGASEEGDYYFTDDDLEKIQISIKQILSDAAPEDAKDLSLSEQERAK